jgi:hypothetical protein
MPLMDKASQSVRTENQPKETAASRAQRREAEIALAMKEEAARRAAVIKNMHRLRALRLSQDLSQERKIPRSTSGAKARRS